MFAGTFEQALDALRTRDRATINGFMKFMDAHPGTVGGWLIGTSKAPTGESKIRALSYFHLIGWQVSEFESLDPLAQSIALLLGFRVTTLPELLDELCLAESYGWGILGYLYGEKELTRQAHKLAQRFVADKAADLERVQTSLAREYVPTQVDFETTVSVPALLSDPVSKLAELLLQVYPLAVELNSDSYSDGQRAKMRELVDRERYVELCVNLSQMKSSRTRHLHRQG